MRSCYSSRTAHEIFLDRKSFPDSEVRRMIKKALELGHVDVLEHGAFTFSLQGVSRSLTHQLVRHRLASYSQQSQRHVSVKRGWYVVPPSLEGVKGKFSLEGKEYEMEMKDFMNLIVDFYKDLLGKVRKEDARFVLPNATMTNITMTANPRELRHVFGLRCDTAAQWEIRDVCWAMQSLSYLIAPTIFSTLQPPAGNVEECKIIFERMKELVDSQREGFERLQPGEVFELGLRELKLTHEVRAFVIKR